MSRVRILPGSSVAIHYKRDTSLLTTEKYKDTFMTDIQIATDPAATDRAITAAADKIIASTCLKHGIQPSDLLPNAIEDARMAAREFVEAEARKQDNEYYHLYEQQKAETEALKAQLGAVRENRAAKADTRTVDTMEMIRKRVGRATWFQLSEAGKLSAMGLDPASVDKNQLRTLFGASTDTAFAVDFMKTNPYCYRQLKQAAMALNITGK
jgi:hypothetical protein